MESRPIRTKELERADADGGAHPPRIAPAILRDPGKTAEQGGILPEAPGDLIGQRAPGRQRKWCIPSAIVRSPGETLDGIPLLDELDGVLGLLLWQTVRSITLWASTPAEVRHQLFNGVSNEGPAAADSSVPEDLRPLLHSILSRLVGPRRRVDPELLTLDCLQVAAWARRGRVPRTALAFAQAGALASPEFPEAALQTAACALDVGESERAETWLRRAIAVARRGCDWVVYSTAYVLLGNIYREKEMLAPAERYLMMGFRAARRAGVPLARRDAAHGLFRIALARGDLPRAVQMADIAQRRCVGQHPNATKLLLEFARFWLDQGQPRLAGQALRRLPRPPSHPEDALETAALTARALAELGRHQSSRKAAERAWSLVRESSVSDDAVFVAVLDLARGAAERGDRAGAGRAARVALRLASAERYEWTRGTLAALQPRLERAA
jgi:tetratricopeptide (TPR) repeat protein